MSKVKFTQDVAQNIVTIITNTQKLIFSTNDFKRMTNYCSVSTFTTRFTKEQWIVSMERDVKEGTVTLERKGKRVTFKLSQIPKSVKH